MKGPQFINPQYNTPSYELPSYEQSFETLNNLDPEFLASLNPEAIFEIKQRRLAILEEKAAFFGPNCPPEIIMEIQDIREYLVVGHRNFDV